ncbi:unnamed protein product [Rotaria sp. Silwood1]|nr:unnamed protein product [Rotaria sp. Silwood1]CAF1632109.1 unnamed protein product [Rotaria sp. Silwood1]CAF3782521.1 unnamed protein product [Rotaria sp. Silwood1]CAF3898195.1 unnamed protein product [Rotaria sp. Silwood1]
MCSRMPLVKICRLPFNYDGSNINQKENFSLGYQMTLPKLLNTNHLRTLTVVKSLDIYDTAWTLQNAERFCTLLSNRFSNLKTLSITICDSYDRWKWRPSHIIDGKNKSTKRILSIIYLLVDRLTQLVSLYIYFFNEAFSDTPCFPYLIRRQLYQYPLSRPYRLRCSSNIIQVWL